MESISTYTFIKEPFLVPSPDNRKAIFKASMVCKHAEPLKTYLIRKLMLLLIHACMFIRIYAYMSRGAHVTNLWGGGGGVLATPDQLFKKRFCKGIYNTK